jgi:hypothetical protein
MSSFQSVVIGTGNAILDFIIVIYDVVVCRIGLFLLRPGIFSGISMTMFAAARHNTRHTAAQELAG